MKVALIHDWFAWYSGAERVVEEILNIYPDADIYTTVDVLTDVEREFLNEKTIHTSYLQYFPFVKKFYKHYIILFPFCVEKFDLSKYDLIISSSSSVAKGVVTTKDQLHVCYIHTPARYVWDLREQYIQETGLNHGFKLKMVDFLLNRFQKWDLSNTHGVNNFIANSNYVKRRVKRIYGRESTVIYPPVDLELFKILEKKEDFYFTASRIVPYKKIDLIVEAFTKMPDKKLIVIGKGPGMSKLEELATPNIQLLGYQPSNVLRDYMRKAKAFIFAAEEDFGIIPVEAQACGTPVIAFKKGGLLETVIENKTGLFFEQQTIESLTKAVERFEMISQSFKPISIRENAMRFNRDRFRNEVEDCIINLLNKRNTNILKQ
jgi:glycosyltransferase involved in cell wall biosynthesis